jgi:adenine-specific DNA-methyltransferase
MPLLDWLNKDEATKTANKSAYRLLEEVPELSYGDKDSNNLLIQGDNLEALKALLPFYAGKVKCIFIDPPYNTKSAFEHYDDNLEHSIWLSTIYPRLELLRELLAEDGSIWITIDDHEVHYLKLICDEIFGRQNFQCDIAWEKRYAPPPDTKGMGYVHDHILCYSKSGQFTRNMLPMTEDQTGRYKNPDNDPRGEWKSADYTCRYTATERPNLYYPIVNPNTNEEIWPSKTRVWAMSKDVTKKNIEEDRIWWGKTGNNTKPALKNFLSGINKGMMPMSLWKHSLAGHTQEAMKEMLALFGDEPFTTPKPERLLQTVITIASNEEDLVLDSFLGSGTTVAVAHKMNRRFIGIEIGEHAVTHCLPRMEKVIDGEQGGISNTVNWEGGGGFRFVRLGQKVFDEFGLLNSDITFATLAAHIWFIETRKPLSAGKVDSPLIGEFDGVAYYLLYNGILGDRRPQGGNVLTSKVLEILPNYEGPKVVYGETSRLSESRLKQQNLTFKQIPYDVKAL